MKLKTTLEQWQTLQAVGEAGSFHAAAKQLNKSHTTLMYAVKKLEQQLEIELIRIDGRRAVLTDAANVLLRRSSPMVDQARELEEVSKSLAGGWESEITLAIDSLCDPKWVYPVLAEFMSNSQGTSVNIFETNLSSTRLMVEQQQADVSIVNLPVTGFLSEAFGVISMVPVVCSAHPLASKSSIVQQALVNVPQIVIRDQGVKAAGKVALDAGWLKAKQRVTVDSFEQAEQAVINGVGVLWLPSHRLRESLQQHCNVLSIQGFSHYQVPIHLVLPKAETTGPAARLLYQLLLDGARG
jgi:DNA-binding transcriptional LysR family regulator